MSNALTEEYMKYISGIRRYSPRTLEIYRESLDTFFEWLDVPCSAGKEECCRYLTRATVRSYEVHLLDEKKESPRTVNLHLSILSGFCRYLMKRKMLEANPVRLVARPKEEKRLPLFYREEAMKAYFDSTGYYISKEFLDILAETRDKEHYSSLLSRIIVSILYGTGIRRSELIGLNVSSFDRGRRTLRVLGKGDKMREIPLTPSLFEELSLYLIAASSFSCTAPTPDAPLLVTPGGSRLYPVFVDRVIKKELGSVEGISCRKSPHVLRHTIASELLSNGTDLNSIKEFLGHSSLAATQVYTHSTIERMRNVYNNAHPRAKNGGKNGD